MSEITVIAHINARPEDVERVGAALDKMLAPTRAEPGCLQYDLLVDVQDPCHFIFYERWESPEAHQTHMDSAHIAEFVVSCKGAIAEATVHHARQKGDRTD